MTEETALLFMTATAAVCSDEDGDHFAIVVEKGGEFLVETPDRRACHMLARDSVPEIATVGAIATIAGAVLPYVGGETVLLKAPTVQAVSAAMASNVPDWIEDVPARPLAASGLHVMFSTMAADALVVAAAGRSTPWILVS
jgi:hypothetical protein